MARFTNGTTTYSRRVKVGDYEWKEASSSITFSTDEGDGSEVLFSLQARAAGENYALVEGALGTLPKRLAEPHRESVAVAPPEAATVSEALSEAPTYVDLAGNPVVPGSDDVAPRRTRRTKAEMEAARAASVGPTTLTPSSEPSLEPSVETSQASSAIMTPTTGGQPAPSVTTVVDDDPSELIVVDDDPMNLATGTPPEITDEDLAAAVNARNAVIKSSPAIRKLIGKFAPNLSSIAQGARKSFLDNLSRLTAEA